MLIQDNVIKKKLENIYFIWGRGKTTISNELCKKNSFFIYSTDESRNRHMKTASFEYQPNMCRNIEKEYGVNSFWELTREVISDYEKCFINELTPMIIADLIILASKYKVVICEGDIDYESIIPVSSHVVYLNNCSTNFDWFNRTDHENIIDIANKLTYLSKAEKEILINKAYCVVSENECVVPDCIQKNEVKVISWNDDISKEETSIEVSKYFRF